MNRRLVAIHFVVFLALVLSVWAMPAGRFVLVLTDPRAPPGQNLSVIGAAGGTFVSEGRFPWMTVAYSDRRDFPSRLMRAGAVLVLNHALAAGCRQKDIL